MMQPLLRECVLERPHHVLLPHELGERPGAPFAGEDLGHRKNGERKNVSGILQPDSPPFTVFYRLLKLLFQSHWMFILVIFPCARRSKLVAQGKMGGEPYPRHLHEIAVAASFRT